MSDYLTLAGTALNKQPRQLLGIATRTVKSSVLPRLPIDIDARYENRIPEELTTRTEPIRQNTVRLQESTVANRDEYANEAAAAVEGEISFLNETVLFEDGASVSVDAPEVLDHSLHWKLKCWGFEHLKPIWLSSHDPSVVSDDEIAVHQAWLEDWIGNHPIASNTRYLRRYWMPHSVCLRILNWARYDSLFADRLDDQFRDEIRRFVYKNAAFLSDNVEHGVGGNHLVENAVALVVAGVYADESAWRRQGRRIFIRAAENQFFGDGGHIERSPMYHLIVCQRFLTAVDLLESLGEGSEEIGRAAADGIEFVERLRPPDDRIPLLNDSVFGEALPLLSCLRYARAVGIDIISDVTMEQSGRSLAESGYYWLGDGDTRLLVAAHEVTVPHLPGHAHVHPGQVCLWVDGKRVLTDTGVFEYAAGPRRQRARSIQSHNTVQVGDTEPVRLASSFWLWGELDPTVRIETQPEKIEFSYSAGGIGQLEYHHGRVIENNSGVWTITDKVNTGDPAVGRFHIDPNYDVVHLGETLEVQDEDSESVLSVNPYGCRDVLVEESPYYPAYGVEMRRDVITFTSRGSSEFGVAVQQS